MNPPPVPSENAAHLAWLLEHRALVAGMTQSQVASIAYFIYGVAVGPLAWNKEDVLARYDNQIRDYSCKVAEEERQAALWSNLG